MNTKGTKFLAVLAVLAMAFAAVAVITNTDDVAAADDDTSYISGTVTTSVTYSNNVVVDKNLTIDSGDEENPAEVIFDPTDSKMTFTINPGVTVTIKSGALIVGGGELIIDGALVLNNGDKAYLVNDSWITVNGALQVLRGGAICTDEAKYGTIIINEGADIQITSNATVQSVIAEQEVLISENAVFSANAIFDYVGVAAYSTASFYQTSAVTIGEKYKTQSNLTFTTSVEKVNAIFAKADKSEPSEQKSIRNYTIDVSGTLGVAANNADL